MRRLFFLLAILLAGSACAPTFNVTMGQMPSSDPRATIESGMTTRAEILELYGPPDFTGADANGLERWTWGHMTVEVKAGKEASLKSFFSLEVSFDGELVESFSYSKKAE